MKRFILLMICILLFTSCSPLGGREDAKNNQPEGTDSQIEITEKDDIPIDYSLEAYSKLLLDNLLSNGPSREEIPPIDKPIFIGLEEAQPWLADEDLVFVLELNSKVYIFPQKILVWHEIVNMKDLTANCFVSYSPLSGSVITYFYPEGDDIIFGTSASLVNSNMIMYERRTESMVAQIHGIGLSNDLYGFELINKPTFWSKWKYVKKAYEEALVLSKDTGFKRDYGMDPYGDYRDETFDNYYYNDSLISEPLYSDKDNVFPAKKTIIGLKVYGKRYAIDKSQIEKAGLVVYENLDIFAVYDESIENVRLYFKPDGGQLSYDKGIIYSSSGMSWSIGGKSIDELDDLVEPLYFEVMWFAWYGFYPDTEIIN